MLFHPASVPSPTEICDHNSKFKTLACPFLQNPTTTPRNTLSQLSPPLDIREGRSLPYELLSLRPGFALSSPHPKNYNKVEAITKHPAGRRMKKGAQEMNGHCQSTKAVQEALKGTEPNVIEQNYVHMSLQTQRRRRHWRDMHGDRDRKASKQTNARA